MSIGALLEAVPPPPAGQGDVFSGQWGTVEAEVRAPLPQDYKDFVRLYGNGYFMEFLGIYMPKARNHHIRLERMVRVVSSGYADWDDLPYPMWPQEGGLIPFGGTDNGDQLFWLPQGTPDEWTVVIFDRGGLCFEAVDRDLTGFLAGLATGEVQPNAFPEDLLPCEHLFQPTPPLAPGAGGITLKASFQRTGWR